MKLYFIFILFTFIITFSQSQINSIQQIEDIIDGIFEQAGLSDPNVNFGTCLDATSTEKLIAIINNSFQSTAMQKARGIDEATISKSIITNTSPQILDLITNLPLSDAICMIKNGQSYQEEYQNVLNAYEFYDVYDDMEDFNTKAMKWIDQDQLETTALMTRLMRDYLLGNYKRVGKDLGMFFEALIDGIKAMDDAEDEEEEENVDMQSNFTSNDDEDCFMDKDGYKVCID